MPVCGDIAGCLDQSEVNIGWYGYKSHDDAAIRNGPYIGAKMREYILPGKRLGWQSIRNPSAGDRPPLRPTKIDDFGFKWAWVYMIDGGTTGWILADTIAPFDNGEGWARGPAGEDFHVGYDHCERGSEAGCGGRVLEHRERQVDAHIQEVYLRYAPQSTAFHFLHGGDTVVEFYRSPMNYRCVQVKRSRSAPVGARGWVLESSLA